MEHSTKRHNIRYLIDLDVTVTCTGQPAMTCKVRDYCMSGMYLIAPENPSAPRLHKDRDIIIEFQGVGKHKHKISATVVSSTKTGYGVRFDSINDDALNSLLAIATRSKIREDERLALAGTWQSDGDSGLQLLLKDTLQRHIISLFSAFHETTVDVMFERASRSKNGDEQHRMFEELDILNAKRQISFQRVYETIMSGFEAFTSGKPQSANRGYGASFNNASSVSLAGDKAFEDWLWANSTITELESHYKMELDELNLRLCYIYGKSVNFENNPFGASVICHTFQALVLSFPIADESRKLVIASFRGVIVKHFAALVRECNHHLISRGILPEIEKSKLPTRSGNSQPKSQPAASSSGRASAGQRHTNGMPEKTGVKTSADIAAASARVASGLANVRTLLREINQSGAKPERRHDNTQSSSESETQANWYNTRELSSAISAIEGQLSSIHANRSKGDSILCKLKEALAHGNGDTSKDIPANQAESIDVIEGLMESVHEDPNIPADSHAWFDHLEKPILKTVISDESLIEKSDHSVARFLNELDELGRSLPEHESEKCNSIRNEITTLIDQVSTDSDEPANRFDQALESLENLHDTLRKQYESNVRELIARCDEEYSLEVKREYLFNLLDDRYGGRNLPGIFFNFMDEGWKDLLLRSYIREGPDGRIFQRYLEIMDQLIARLTADFSLLNTAPWPATALLDLIPRALRQVPVKEQVIEQLMKKLKPQLAMAAVDPASIAHKQMPRLGTQKVELDKRAIEQRIHQLNIPGERWKKAEESVESLNNGDMLSFAAPQGERHTHRLVWSAADNSRLVFVDGEGKLSRDVSKNDLTLSLLSNEAAVLEGWDVPLMDRATYAMLLTIHSKLLHQTNYDALTGLYNKRAFDLELDKHIETNRIEKTKGIICYLDLDSFSQVNSSCGRDKGDLLLTEVAKLLRSNTPADSLLGRLEADKFALVVPDMSRTQGLALIRKIQQAMHKITFSCDTQANHLTASFGLTEVNESSEEGSCLLAAVVKACRTAKTNGRDRIDIYHSDETDNSRREKLQAIVTNLQQAMNNQQLQLACQRIVPLSRNDTTLPYYEILLRAQDESGNPISHAEFIQAAEMYGRTNELDLWVTTNAIKWLEQRLSADKQLPIVSINLSGRAVNSKEFMDTIVARLIKSEIPRNHVCFEITETAAIGDMGQATHFINRIKRLGCSFSLDDFGTGLTSHSYLKALPVDYIKIDGSFVRNCHNEPRDLAVIKSINEISHAMGKKTIAEFVESNEILEHLQEIGVDYAQGYGIEKPIPLNQLK